MAESVNIIRKIYGKNTFSNVVDVSFKQLVPQDGNPAEDNNQSENQTVESFFDSYDTLFYDIPPSGSDTSHLEIVKRSGDYIGLSFDDLQEEIRNLREENVSLKNQIFLISNTRV
jgi:hypothetical protein